MSRSRSFFAAPLAIVLLGGALSGNALAAEEQKPEPLEQRKKPEAPLTETDRRIVRMLELLENLELLQDLEVLTKMEDSK